MSYSINLYCNYKDDSPDDHNKHVQNSPVQSKKFSVISEWNTGSGSIVVTASTSQSRGCEFNAQMGQTEDHK